MPSLRLPPIVSRIGPYAAALLASLLALSAVWLIDRAVQERYERDRRAELLVQMSEVRARIESALNARLYTAHALAAYVVAKQEIDQDTFEAFAHGLVTRQAGIRAVALTRDTLVTNVYPRANNAAVLGVDLMTLPDQRETVWRAYLGRQFVLAGPMLLDDGSTVVVARLPIFVDGEAGGDERYLGLSMVVIDFDVIVDELGLLVGDPDYRWALRGRDGWGPHGESFLGDPGVFDAAPALLDVVLPSGVWQLAAVPYGGWQQPSPDALWVRIGGGLIAALIAVLMYFLVRDPARLREVVDEATLALRQHQELLEQRVRERTNELSTLLRVSHTVASTLEMEQVVELILDQLEAVISYRGARVWLREGDQMRLLADRGPQAHPGTKGLLVPMSARGWNAEVLRRGEPIIVGDMRADGPSEMRDFLDEPSPLNRDLGYLRAWLGVPLIARDRIIGLLSIGHEEPGHFEGQHAALALAFASQAAVAIENARLYEAAQDRATLEERQRLARELHDAVTQTLFSASLIADVLPRIMARDPEQGSARLEELRQLTRGALAEMRTLLLELRPGVLTEVSLGELLRQLGDAFTGRARVPVRISVDGQGDLPPEVQVALFRVAQEALNNVAKHAGASQVEVRLRHAYDAVELTVEDDGRGFDADLVPGGHLGLGIMRERAESVGARFGVERRSGGGTSVRVRWPRALAARELVEV